jgi:hypothetical protein
MLETKERSKENLRKEGRKEGIFKDERRKGRKETGLKLALN